MIHQPDGYVQGRRALQSFESLVSAWWRDANQRELAFLGAIMIHLRWTIMARRYDRLGVFLTYTNQWRLFRTRV